MNANLFKTTVAALALATLTFNSCKDKEETEEEYQFPYEKVTLTLEDGMVFTDIEKYRDANFISIGDKDYSKYDIYMGTSPDSCQKKIVDDIKPFTKYYWYVVAHEPNKYDNTAQSEIRTFFYISTPQITKVYNPEGDWATILKWEHIDCLKEAIVTLTPDKDCQYDKTPIVFPAAQDSCYISAGGEFDSKYAVYHQWWDDSKAQYYEPVIYGFNVTFNVEIDGQSFSVTSDTVKYIFLDRAKYAADKYFNVYRMGRIGNRTWLLDDLRGKYGSSCEVISPLGFKARAYNYDAFKYIDLIPDGFHLATDEDWQDLEYTYGVEKTDCSNYIKSDVCEEIINTKITMGFALRNANWPNLLDDYNKEINDTIKYVGKDTGVFKKLISENEWITTDTLENIIKGSNGFNARPYGRIQAEDKTACFIGTLSVFLTSTKDPTDNYSHIIRYLWSGNQGIVRVSVDGCRNSIYYMLRCVKDE